MYVLAEVGAMLVKDSIVLNVAPSKTRNSAVACLLILIMFAIR